MRVNLQPAYVLHGRPYRDTSLLLEVFTAEHGRISLVGRGARRRSRGGSSGALLQPFIPLLLSFSGRGELKTLTATEAAAPAVLLAGERLFSALYLNELLLRLLHRNDPHPELFAAYGEALQALASAEQLEGVLRRFEFRLLDELGYRVDLAVDGHSGEAVREECWYTYQADQGLVRRSGAGNPSQPAFSGADLLRIAAGQYDGEARPAARRLMRQVLAGHLGSTPLKSRELFRRSGAGHPPGSPAVTGDER
jgi:DNA repair protein RecO (recombination protein O)